MKVLFFASLKEQLNCGELEVNEPTISTVQELKEQLANRGEPWASALNSTKLLVAVNQEVTDFSAPISNDDDIAFFPPVTGG
ncbi:molybdopterin synthase sulfur carrier subunit [Oleiphilus sp. HI0009]|uniref:molybdopterin converting factor subunit 1 n=1 Tax=unclassified Oleiphilus TaxID=2631174 RepID=UPI0007C3D81D|nr:MULTISPECIES: molybdopterin converting factor subunit 1 [unclassified Oleiphilus]KZX85452.1 molybdopterin synthase sulfur carrier subunit [Oleiphilus sp. HI0009]KZX86298.1 molybdopterin synthase sulfur carrier subunit [Oleiphilus sp. HI0009]KZY64106.1 molybdopterin synthase sulfur carrier subunit [Oleiphilus sp. HI0066]KZY69903.1 molybdopterin synthase sulfur carrier subunit [Oleiphilus sp. HI0067]KZZ60066.1 molybdopterin synthase sulfur carrier subunit [Oleiphilus sp. HI0125]